MAIATATDLKAALADWLIRADLPSTRLTDFITLAESRLSRLLRVRDMETSTGLTTSAAGAVALPADYLEWISVQLSGNYLRYAESDSEEWRIRQRPFDNPQVFTVMAGELLVRPALAGSVTFKYYKKIASLTAGETNWLLTRAPDIYLHAVLSEAQLFAQDRTSAVWHWQAVERAAQELTMDNDSAKTSRRPARLPELAADASDRAPETRPV